MAIQATDLLLINRSGSSFYVEYSDILTKVQDTDIVLVNRNGASHKITGRRFKHNGFDNSDLFLVNRSSQSFKCPGSEFSFPYTTPTFQKAEWAFVSKTTQGSTFRLTVSWTNFGYIYRPKIDSFDIALGTSPATLVAGTNLTDKYEETNWSSTSAYVDQSINTDILTINNTGGGSVSMLFYVGNQITMQGGNTISAKSALGTGETWNGFVNMYYNGQTTVNEPQQFTSFSGQDSMFN